MYYLNPYDENFTKEELDWLYAVGDLFEQYWHGEEKFDPFAWIQDCRKGVSPSDAFYKEYPELRERMLNYDDEDYCSYQRARERDLNG